MSYYYKYNFVSPEPLFAVVKEELKSYFDTGAVDDLLFPVYVNKCLEKLGRGTHPIVPVLLVVEDYIARLPENFYAIREAWYCTWADGTSYTTGKAFYSQASSISTAQLSPVTIGGESQCTNPVCEDPDCGGDCQLSVVQAVYKTIEEIPRTSFKRSFLLKPGRISYDPQCEYNYHEEDALYGTTATTKPQTPTASSWDSFDIQDNQFVTTFRHGIVEALMYVSDFDNLGNQMIPDNYRIREYIEAFIKYKVFETITNQTYDETFNQLQQKLMYYKMMAEEAYTMAEMEIKKQDIYTKQRRIRKLKNRFDKFELPSSSTSKYYRGRRPNRYR